MRGLAITIQSAGYRGRSVLTDLSLPVIAPGCLAAIVGPNAAGKSTLMKAIAGLCQMRGKIALDAEDLGALRPVDRMRKTAYLPQIPPQPTSLLAYETVLGVLRATRQDLGRAAAAQAVEAVFDSLRIHEIALYPLSEMSGGQRQMVGLAQVMVRAPRLLLLDEPTSALDLHWQLDVIRAVREATRRDGVIALMAIHDLNLAIRTADRVIVLAAGKVLADGLPEEAISASILRRAYGVDARIERCSRGTPIILIDGPAAQGPSPEER
ncbi:ABC transporter ATP-binding protein [Rhodoligotrophos defluvii]|uniref:ABC transporter ATP-binding protein n=1 Tax=Rhodoligotrophos defluvii TaxID=2561934 RepID=UPI0010C9790B|nr:ABC transporter ATP-binding protein [Rhodoligotrophos defluvii]